MFKKNDKISTGSSTVPSMISGNAEIIGDIKSEGVIRYDGVLRGNIIADNVILGSNSSIEGKVIANDLTVYGKVNGEIYAKFVSLMKTSNVVGDLYKDTISIESGAKYSGRTMELNLEDLTVIPTKEAVRMISYKQKLSAKENKIEETTAEDTTVENTTIETQMDTEAEA